MPVVLVEILHCHPAYHSALPPRGVRSQGQCCRPVAAKCVPFGDTPKHDVAGHPARGWTRTLHADGGTPASAVVMWTDGGWTFRWGTSGASPARTGRAWRDWPGLS